MMLPPLPTYDEIVREFEWDIPEFFNIGSAVCQRYAEQEPDKTALIGWHANGAPSVKTYGELHETSNRLANALVSLGMERGDRVAIILPQSLHTAVSHIAIYKSGAIAVPLARLFAREALAYRLGHSGARFVITNQDGFDKISAIRDQLPKLEAVIVTDGNQGEAISFDKVTAAADPHFSSVKSKSDDPALIIYTSGTTGPPKGALHGHRVLLGHIPGLQVHHEFIPKPNDIAWTPADWAWAGGLLNILLPCLYMGVPVVYGGMDRFDPEQAFRLLSETKTTCAFIPPTALRLMKTVDSPAKRYRLALRTIGTGGESLGRDAYRWAENELGLKINEFYGQTECNLVLSGFAARGISKPGSIGKAVPGHQVAVLNAQGDICEVHESGEVAIKRPDPVMFLNYWQDEKATNDKFRGDWMMTGDQCVVDEEGYYTFVGRDDDIISSAGYRLGPGEIEDCLVSHPAVKLAVAVGKPDKLRGEVVKAYIILDDKYLSDGGPASVDGLVGEIQAHVKQRLAANIFPREIEIVEEIPLTTTGKVIRRVFRQRAIEEAQSEC